MLSDTMLEKLNQQVQYEFGAEHRYLAIAACFDREGLKKFGALFFQQAAEEHSHAMRIVDYIMRRGGAVEFRGVEAPPNDYPSGEAMVQAALEAELFVTKCVDEITELAEAEKDYATRSFIQWKVDEQVEEVEKMTDLLTLVQMAGPNQLLLIENRLIEFMGPAE